MEDKEKRDTEADSGETEIRIQKEERDQETEIREDGEKR